MPLNLIGILYKYRRVSQEKQSKSESVSFPWSLIVTMSSRG